MLKFTSLACSAGNNAVPVTHNVRSRGLTCRPSCASHAASRLNNRVPPRWRNLIQQAAECACNCRPILAARRVEQAMTYQSVNLGVAHRERNDAYTLPPKLARAAHPHRCRGMDGRQGNHAVAVGRDRIETIPRSFPNRRFLLLGALTEPTKGSDPVELKDWRRPCSIARFDREPM